MKLSSTIIKSLRRCVKPLAITAISIWALVVTLPVAAQVYSSYSALDGGPGAPAYAFNSSTNSGWFRDPVANAVAVAVNGIENIRFKVGTSTIAPATIITGQVRAGGSNGAPALSACGTSTIAGSDMAGTITLTAAASTCTLTFAKAYVTAPVCYFNDETTVAITQGALYKVVPTTTTVVVTLQGASGASDVIRYLCIGSA